MKTTHHLTATLLATACAAPAWAQPPEANTSTLRFAASELSHERTVKGAPYCAEAVHETVQWLPDPSASPGAAPNRIVRQTSSRLCRDGEGRTRQEVTQGSRPTVYLRDPVGGESWVLDSERKTARRLSERSRNDVELGYDSSAWRAYAEQMREWARDFSERTRASVGVHGAARPASGPVAPWPLSPPSIPTPPSPPSPPSPPTPPTPVVIERDLQLHVLRFDAERSASGAFAVPPVVQMRSLSMAPRGPGSLSPLPAREIDGLRANGERTTWTIEAGKVGNERPIQIVREVWTSPELMLTLATRDFDPRSGEQNYRLKNLKRGEPDAALFRVPADYAQNTTRRVERATPKPADKP